LARAVPPERTWRWGRGSKSAGARRAAPRRGRGDASGGGAPPPPRPAPSEFCLPLTAVVVADDVCVWREGAGSRRQHGRCGRPTAAVDGAAGGRAIGEDELSEVRVGRRFGLYRPRLQDELTWAAEALRASGKVKPSRR
jgi:hypothetical protein